MQTQETGGQPSGETVEQAHRDSGQLPQWKFETKPVIHEVERRAEMGLPGGCSILATESPRGLRYVTFCLHSWEFCEPRTFEQVVNESPAWVLGRLREAVAYLEKVV